VVYVLWFHAECLSDRGRPRGLSGVVYMQWRKLGTARP
jgi:hypothetical protein